MTAELLDLAALTARSGVPTPRLRQYAEAGLLPPARRDGNRLGNPPAESNTVRMLAGAEDLGIDAGTLATLAVTWRDGDCARTRTTTVQRGPCSDDCGCIGALATAGTAYRFPHDPAVGALTLACDLVADGGDVHNRIGVWQQVLGRVERRELLPDDPYGLALRFPFDIDLAGALGRLAAAEYRCCSFGSYTLVVDGTGLRLEIRMPAGAAGMLAAVVGMPDGPADNAGAR